MYFSASRISRNTSDQPSAMLSRTCSPTFTTGCRDQAMSMAGYTELLSFMAYVVPVCGRLTVCREPRSRLSPNWAFRAADPRVIPSQSGLASCYEAIFVCKISKIIVGCMPESS